MHTCAKLHILQRVVNTCIPGNRQTNAHKRIEQTHTLGCHLGALDVFVYYLLYRENGVGKHICCIISVQIRMCVYVLKWCAAFCQARKRWGKCVDHGHRKSNRKRLPEFVDTAASKASGFDSVQLCNRPETGSPCLPLGSNLPSSASTIEGSSALCLIDLVFWFIQMPTWFQPFHDPTHDMRHFIAIRIIPIISTSLEDFGFHVTILE